MSRRAMLPPMRPSPISPSCIAAPISEKFVHDVARALSKDVHRFALSASDLGHSGLARDLHGPPVVQSFHFAKEWIAALKADCHSSRHFADPRTSVQVGSPDSTDPARRTAHPSPG